MTMKQPEDVDRSEAPQLCKAGCGFYGNLKTRNLCSVCFKVVLQKEASKQTVIAVNVADTVPLKKHHSVEVKKKNRCQVCNKRVGLIGFGCRCGHSFCGLHRMPEEHACKFDFKAAGRAVLEKENPVCVADKLETRI
ncbi:putative transcription regulator A20-like family [Helianthus annuus]|uniref:Putative zinc finger A20 and AN1 domain-containing stress-associated protein 7 n=1 Tax=Helianthus annuus TaxID=4232 RepID=A0A251U5J7_HELAN|nr:AN1-type zinc finger protein 5 [Helianthus annuus]KAF5795408.1 putative transcription regulator A20-like family [Helianthus annuus]KAJ0719220.1 putative transcription regulator A20-like family [Helianthus annuus]KAJ0722456.1 putative transcription regulator A20-like family [Helianthus annuus]